MPHPHLSGAGTACELDGWRALADPVLVLVLAGEPGVTQVQVGGVLHQGHRVLPRLSDVRGHLLALTFAGLRLAAERHRLGDVAVGRQGERAADDLRPDRAELVHGPVSYTHLRAHETVLDLVCRLLL